MAIVTDISPLIAAISKLSDAEKLQLNQLVMEKVIEGSDIKRINPIVTGVVCGTLIPYIDKGSNWEYGTSTAGLTSNCDDLDCDVSATFSVKTWETGKYKCTPTICFADLECEVKDYFGSEKCNEGNPEPSQWLDFIVDLIAGYIKNSHWGKVYFADTTSANTAWNGHDGIFVQADAIVAAAPTQLVPIPENALATKALQLALDPARAYEVFNAMYNAMPDEMFIDHGDVKFFVTLSMARNYLNWLQVNKEVLCCERDPMFTGYSLENLNYLGIPVVIVVEWDQIIKTVTEFDLGATWDNPHRVILTASNNMPIGTCDESELTQVNVKYDDFSEITKIITKFDIGAKILQDNCFIYAV